MTLTEFLLARIAEDEALARSVGHIPAWGSRRCLADCKAKRLIVEDYLTFRKVSDERAEGTPLTQALTAAGIVTGYERSIATLALPYADHPDYQEEWRP